MAVVGGTRESNVKVNEQVRLSPCLINGHTTKQGGVDE
jgi:hypothetical protein